MSKPSKPSVLTVIIPTVGRAALLEEQLEALRQCHWDHEWDIVIADNGSSDGTEALCAAWSERMPRLRWIDVSQTRGRSYAVNAAVAQVNTPYAVFCDDDDVVNPEFVASVGAAFLSGADVVTFNLDVESLNPEWVVPRPEDRPWSSPPQFMNIPAVWGNFGIRRDIFINLGGFDERLYYAEDLEFSVRLNDDIGGLRRIHIDEPLIKYRLRNTLRARFRQSSAYGRAREELLRMHPHLSPAQTPRARWRVLASGCAQLVKLAPRRLTSRRGRYELAQYAGRQWGRFLATSGN